MFQIAVRIQMRKHKKIFSLSNWREPLECDAIHYYIGGAHKQPRLIHCLNWAFNSNSSFFFFFFNSLFICGGKYFSSLPKVFSVLMSERLLFVVRAFCLSVKKNHRHLNSFHIHFPFILKISNYINKCGMSFFLFVFGFTSARAVIFLFFGYYMIFLTPFIFCRAFFISILLA